MIRLNLPSFDIKVSGSKQHPQILDVLRRKFITLTPEEWVRQHFVHFLIEHKGYPASLLANEIQLKCGDKVLRADSVLYSRELQPRMIIEYKAPHISHHAESVRPDFGLQSSAPCRLSGGEQRAGALHLQDGL